MKRRDLLVGAAGAAAVAAGGVYALRPQSPDVVRSAEARRLYPREQASVTVPTSGEVTFVEFLASWCSICESMMPEVAEARRRVDDANFVGVTYEAVGTTVSEEDVVDWWTSNDGDWTLVHDEDHELTEEFEAAGVPETYVVDASGRVAWSDSGYHSADEIAHAVESAL